MKKIVALVLVACLCLALAMVASAEGSVYYLNFKPEQDAQWQELAKIYTDRCFRQLRNDADERNRKERPADAVPGQRSGRSGELERLLL